MKKGNEQLSNDSKRGSWDHQREVEFRPLLAKGLVPGRILSANREFYRLRYGGDLTRAHLSGHLQRQIMLQNSPPPVVGDWIALSQHADCLQIESLLSRRNYFSRQHAGSFVGEQVIAANLDYLLIVMGLDLDFNLKRLDRYLVMARKGGVQPVVVLSKADLCNEVTWHLARTRYEREASLAVQAVCAWDEHSLCGLRELATAGASLLFCGSSGAGKSTLINALLGSCVARTAAVSLGNARGRGTTTLAQGYEASSGALLIDAPGLRELQLWATPRDLDAAFSEVAELAATCKFRDCRHQGEPGCALSEALLEGRLSHEYAQSYLKLRAEVEETSSQLRQAKRTRFKAIAIANRARRRSYGS